MAFCSIQEAYQYLVWDIDAEEDTEDVITSTLFQSFDRDGAEDDQSRRRNKKTSKRKKRSSDDDDSDSSSTSDSCMILS